MAPGPGITALAAVIAQMGHLALAVGFSWMAVGLIAYQAHSKHWNTA